MRGDIPNGEAVDLARLGRVPVTSKTVLFAASVDAIDGGLSEPGQTLHLQVVDITSGAVWLVPCSDKFATTLADQLTELVGQHTRSGE